MRLIAISDTHGFHHRLEIPEGDILVHTGDLTRRGTLEDARDFNRFLAALPHRHKIVIAGNHDFCFENRPEQARPLLKDAIYLQDEAIEVEGLKFYGSPWQPEFGDWAFNLARGKPLQDTWSRIPEDTDVLLTHGPPHGCLDRTHRGERVGCEDLTRRLRQVRPKLHVFGHIHEAYGEKVQDGTRYVNASIYQHLVGRLAEPVIIDL